MDKYKYTINYQILDYSSNTYPHIITTMRDAVTLLAAAGALAEIVPAYVMASEEDSSSMKGIIADILWSLPVEAQCSINLRVFSTTLISLTKQAMETRDTHPLGLFTAWLDKNLIESLKDYRVNVTGYWAEDEEEEEE
jgi:hypothetical protein